MLRAALRKSIPALVFLALVLAIAWRLWWPDPSVRRTFHYDALWQYWGDLHYQIDAYEHHELPLWNPFDRGGYPANADPTSALLYPVNWAMVGLGALTGPRWWLVAVKTLFHLWLCGLGTYVLVRRRAGPQAAYAAGMMVVLTYPVSKTLATALNWAAAWSPWMLLTIELWAERPTPRRAAALAATFALCNLGWSPAAALYALLIAIPYGLWAIASNWSRGDAWRRAALRTGGLAIALFAGMVAAQLYATAQLVPETVRSTRDLEFIAFSVIGPFDLFGMFVARLPGEMLYLGFAVVLWAVVAVTLRPEPRRLVLAGVVLLGIAMALGLNAPFLPAIASAPGPFGLFRRAHRYMQVSTLPLALLAADGFEELRALGGASRRRVVVLVAAAGAIGAVVFLVGALVQRGEYGAAFTAATISALAAGATTAWLASGRLPRVAPWAALVVLVLDLWIGGAPLRDRQWVPQPTTDRDAEALALPGLPLGTRIYDRAYIRYRPGTRLRVRDFGGYQDDPLALSRYAFVRDLAQGQPRLLASLGVRWLLEDDGIELHKSPADLRAMTQVRRGVWEIKDPVPPVFFVDHAKVAADPDAARNVFRTLAPGEVVVEGAGDASIPATGNASITPGTLTDLSLDSLRAEIDAPAAGVVVIGEAYYPHDWQATVDGEPARILAANVWSRAVVVGPGHHVIEMRYRPVAWFVLALISIGTMAVTLVLLLRRR